MNSLDLALVGNGAVAALVDRLGTIVWGCFPRFDGDPMFCSLLEPALPNEGMGSFAVELHNLARDDQAYLPNTPILVTQLYDHDGGAVEITDFAPRFRQFGRVFSPTMLIRQVRRVSGTPRIRIRVRPTRHYGQAPAETTWGSHHIRYLGSGTVLRLTTDASITALLEENPFFLEDRITLILGPDETVQGSVEEIGRRFLEETRAEWREWVRSLGIPFEWQDEVIRAAITLKLNTCEDTGAIIAAVTTSIPEAAGSGRNWDYRFCWLRDAYFVINALNQLGATRIMEGYVRYILNIIAGEAGQQLDPVYSITGRAVPEEQELTSLRGYRGMGPVRVGNQAARQVQHDVYGSAVLAATHVFFDRRLVQRGDKALFRHLESLGELAARLFDQPDAGPWEFRTSARIHTFSSVMCWAACDRLARIAAHLGLDERADYWQRHARRIHDEVARRAWNSRLGSFAACLDGDTLDASALLLHEVGFLAADDPRFAGTVAAIERELRRGTFVLRYDARDDFGVPENAFVVCTFWYINALAALGRREEARALFETLLAHRNRHGLLSEHIDPRTGEQWGNFVQTYSMVGLINCALRLSIPWDRAV